MTTNDGGPAFPMIVTTGVTREVITALSGMSLRDYFAANATDKDVHEYMITGGTDNRSFAKYLYADDMLKQREVK